MKRAACERTWEAEALENGRLGSAERNAFERHAAACETCRKELDDLRLVRETMQHLPEFEANLFEQRHQRNRLLQLANMTANGLATRRRAPAWLAAAAVGLALVGAASASMLLGKSHDAPPPSAPRALRSAAPAPRLGSGFAPDSQRVAQESAEVANRPSETAPAARTAAVTETRPEVTSPPSVRSSSKVAALGPSQRGSASVREPAPSAAASTATAAEARAVTRASAADESFAAAIAAFRGGSYARAERLFADFAAGATHDPRVEDAAFLRAVSRARSGDATGAAALARDYLRAFPHGLRRAEAERLAAPR